MRKALLVTLGLALSVGCYKNVGPVVTNVTLDHGALRYTRCDLIVSKWFLATGSDDFEHCVDENGADVSSPTPEQPHALEMPVTTKGDAGR